MSELSDQNVWDEDDGDVRPKQGEGEGNGRNKQDPGKNQNVHKQIISTILPESSNQTHHRHETKHLW
jgi:hypothetical protein